MAVNEHNSSIKEGLIAYEKPLAGAIKTSTFSLTRPRNLVVELVVRLCTSLEKSKRRTKRPRSPLGAYA